MPSLSQFSLADKIVVITGATGMLGASMSLAVAEAGAKVAILGRNAERAEARAAAIRAVGGEALVILGDVLDTGQMNVACNTIMSTWGRIDGLVNAAGGNMPGATVGPGQDLFDVGIEDTRRAVDLNLFGTVIPTTVFGRVMANQGTGAIVNISSITAQRPLTRVLGYTLAKTAIEGYTRWMATELGLRYGGGIRMNAIAPGVFLTEQNHSLLIADDGSHTERARKLLLKLLRQQPPLTEFAS